MIFDHFGFLGFSTTELLLIILVILLLFGSRTLPRFARNTGFFRHEPQKDLQEGNEKEQKSRSKKKSRKTS